MGSARLRRAALVATVAVLFSLIGTASASEPTARQAIPVQAVSSVGQWLASGQVPDGFRSSTGRMERQNVGDPLTRAQLAAAYRLLPTGYHYSGVSRQGRNLSVIAVYPSTDKQSNLVGLLHGALAEPEAAPKALVRVGAAVTQHDAATDMVTATGQLAGGPMRQVTQKAAADPVGTCRCGDVLVVKLVFQYACNVGAAYISAYAGPAMTPARWAGDAACKVVSETVIEEVHKKNCETCQGTMGVFLYPAEAEGWQSTNRPTTSWTVSYNPALPDGYTTDIQVSAPFNGDLARKKAVNHKTTWNAGHVVCCTSYNYSTSVTVTVEFPWEYGYATGNLYVHRYGA